MGPSPKSLRTTEPDLLLEQVTWDDGIAVAANKALMDGQWKGQLAWLIEAPARVTMSPPIATRPLVMLKLETQTVFRQDLCSGVACRSSSNDCSQQTVQGMTLFLRSTASENPEEASGAEFPLPTAFQDGRDPMDGRRAACQLFEDFATGATFSINYVNEPLIGTLQLR